ncbi:tyrosine-type recombinase/integrase [Synechococcus elongatus]|uniref:Tyr recombinase domain-containing protein n=1 Tax=Synechococcus sp. (strain ATCC 27144 / PCC 6301 / SAUG 1402/1) TaxID=269084 RepID=A0A0H3K4G2_SYNP6|nr:tyrosine-type recombinase/integrase [Synechococcus elongatus]MBD2689803.1 tyrosine-type recombinase/integrase [Synechococcus elongatus FACHB-1061]MBD2588608.1 tyrosine-type recombinase/integrase [Synechococcus elongatus FACHB-242]MBD2708410.1 tyrosine-type recombinase/integrase [Synechococcus elongatus PCC 7942 = FACHB-805]WKW06293.1 tyrosine-type recombinase/integrase [Synechococcus elongatus PCC 7942 = FACHB-805]BAD79004.1 hypothetical protein syc0814_c [Synechococcus elongatus PCC 6301]
MRLTIERRKASLYLRGNLPPKLPGGEWKQQRMPLGLDATPLGVKQAEAKAHQVGLELQMDRFRWQDHVELPIDASVMSGLVHLAEERYFSERDRTAKTLSTWQRVYVAHYRQIGLDKPFSLELIHRYLSSKRGFPNALQKAIVACRFLCAVANQPLDARPWQGVATRREVVPRELPTQQQIVDWFDHLKNMQLHHQPEFRAGWIWVYAAIATYGLRPHEAWYLDLDSLRKSKGKRVWLKDGKTGPRWVYPCPPQWVQRFDLCHGGPPPINVRNNQELGTRAGQWAKANGVPPLYGLRHSYAVRLIEYEFPVTVAAKMMGHSPQVHTETYHRWLGDREVQSYAEDLLR